MSIVLKVGIMLLIYRVAMSSLIPSRSGSCLTADRTKLQFSSFSGSLILSMSFSRDFGGCIRLY